MRKEISLLLSLAGIGSLFAVTSAPDRTVGQRADYGLDNAPWQQMRIRSNSRVSAATTGKSIDYSRDYVRRLTAGRNFAINGFVAYSANGSDGNPVFAKGMYHINSDGNFTNLNATDFSQDLDASYGGTIAADNNYYCVYVWDSGDTEIGMVPFIQQWNASTWQLVDANFGNDAGVVSHDLTYDPVSGNIYGIFVDGSSCVLGILDVENNTRTTVAPLDRNLVSIAASDDGRLYGIDFAQGQLWSINPTTGATTFIGATGVKSLYTASACYDSASGKILWTPTTSDTASGLYAIDPQTAATEKICDFNGAAQVLGIYATEATALSATPAAVANLALNLEGGALEGTVTFTAPAANADGSTGTGELNYLVTIDGAEFATGTCAYGADVSLPVTLTRGNHTVIASVSNAVGSSPIQQLTMFAGFGTPQTPAVTVSREGDVNTITWDAVTTTTDGGYIYPADVRYRVVRFPDAVTVAAETEATTFADEVASASEFSYFYYEVTAINGGIESQPGQSNRLDGGRLTPPYLNDFNDADDLDGYTILNVNEDNIQWILDSNAAYLKYHGSHASDDWLITPGITLEGGKTYEVKLNVKVKSARYPEQFEMFAGNAATVEAMTISVIPAASYTNTSYEEVSAYLTVPTGGEYFVGIHGMSAKNMYGIYIDDLSITGPISGESPAAASDAEIVPSPDGTPSATISLKAPDTNIAGEALDAISTLTLSRSGAVVKTFDNPAPGAVLSFTDSASEEGEYEYSAIATNSHGVGQTYKFKAYLGVNVPGSVTVVNVAEPQIGHVTITWPAPEVDANGHPINADLITYNLFRPNEDGYMTSLIRGITETSYSYLARPASVEQDFEMYGVQAATRRGTATIRNSDWVPVGTAYTLPYKESYHGAATHHIQAVKFITGGEWNLVDDSTLTGIQSVDHDGGFVAMYSNIASEESMLHSGKIDLTGATKPVLTFYTYNIVARDPDTGEVVGDPDNNTLTVSINDRTAGFVSQLSLVMNDLPLAGWNKIQVDLSAFVGKTIELGFTAKTITKQYTCLDDIRVFDLLPHNLAVADFTVPAKVAPNTPFDVTVRIENIGENAESDYTVDLYRNGEVVATQQGSAIASGESLSVTFPQTLSVVDEEENVYKAVLTFAQDADTSDNTSAEKTMKQLFSNAPVPTDLTATADGSEVVLNWTAPDLNVVVGNETTDDFESYDAFATSDIGAWTLVDADDLPIGNMNSIGMPGITSGTHLSFFINDTSFAGWKGTIDAHSGSKMLAQVYPVGGAADDWAISPKLFGGEQTITFYARSYNSRFLESLEMLYSLGGTETSEFVRVKSISAVPGAWTKYTFQVPDGAQYFAIRCTSDDCAMLFIDDVTFKPFSEAALDLVGYNIYRDGVKINAAPVTDTSYIDNVAVSREAAVDHVYQVSAVFAESESRPSGSVAVSVVTGLGSIGAEGISVAAHDGFIRISGAEGREVTVADAAGRILFRGIGRRDMTVAAQGVCIVKAAGRTFKVIVK